MNKVLVTGGNGNLGKHVVEVLLNKGIRTAVLTTKKSNVTLNNLQFFTGDLLENIGLKEATAGVEGIIHCASNPRNFLETDIVGTTNLLNALDRNSIKHFIYISIVGIDKSDYPYYQGKLEVENIIANSGIPFTILRTTQFHDFVLNMIKTLDQSEASDSIKIPSGLRFQSVAIQEVAELLVSLSLEESKGLIEDFGGPEILHLEEMTKFYLEAIKSNKLITLEEPEDIRHKLFTTGVNLCPENHSGKQTWKKYLTKAL